MSYKYYQQPSKSIAQFMMDDPTPFNDYSGHNQVANTKAGTSNPTQSVPLVSGAAYSSEFSNSAVGEFTCNFFQQGIEERNWAMAAWLLPIQTTTGYSSPSTKTNLEINPITTAGNYAYSTSAWGTAPTSSFPASGGPDNGTYKRGTATVAFTPAAQSVIMLQQIALTGITATASILAKVGETYTVSIYVRSSIAQSVALLAQPLTAAGAGATGAGNGGDVTLAANTWTRLSVTWTATDVNTAALRLDVRASFGGSRLAWAIGDTFDVASVLITSGSTLYPYFDGNYVGYKWNGTTNASTATTNPAVSLINYALNPTGGGGTTTFAWGAIGAGAGTTSAVVDATAPVGGGFVRRTTTDTNAGGIGVNTFNVPEGTINSSVWVRSSVATTFNLFVQGTAGKVANSPTFALAANTWQRISVTHTITRAGTLQVGGFYTTNLAIGVTLDFTGAMSVQGSTVLPYFDGTYVGAAFNGTNPTAPSYMIISEAAQQILSHLGANDGLSLSGNVLRFSTDYLTTGSAACTYDLQISRKAFVVAQHSYASNELWVDGQLVASVPISNAQQNDIFIATTNKLYCGVTTSSQRVALNGVAFYNSLTSEDIRNLYEAGNMTVPQSKIAPQFNGDTYNLNRDFGTYYIDQTWENTADFDLGETTNIGVAGDLLTPILDGTLTSMAGTWKIGVALDNTGATSIYGVALQWSGSGMTVDVSLDGTTWTPAVNGQLVSIISSGFNPTGQDMHVRVSFAGGILNDSSYMDSIRAIGFLDNTFTNGMGRAVTVGSPAVLRDDYEPILYRDDNGVRLNGATLTIGTDTSSEPKTARTLEVWMKILSGTPTINVTGTAYRNGVADSTMPIGEWMLLHIVAGSDIATSITINGDVIVGQTSIYPTALTANNIAYIWQSYTGKPIVSVNDPGAIGITEPGSPVLIYAHDWSVDGGGG